MIYRVLWIGDGSLRSMCERKFQFAVEWMESFPETTHHGDEESCFDRAITTVLDSDFILVAPSEEECFSIGARLMLAKMYKIPVYVISEDQLLPEHCAFWGELCTRFFENVDNVSEYLNDLYSHSRIRINQSKKNNDEFVQKLKAFDAGYDTGYMEATGFWGEKPAMLVQKAAGLLDGVNEVRCLDLGCGTGKNAAFLSGKGFDVTAYDSSYYAIKEARELTDSVHWRVRDIRKCTFPKETYNIVVMTGMLHCLLTEEEVRSILTTAQNATKIGGYHVVAVFNDGKHDMSGHSEDFNPILLPHQFYMDMYQGWKMIAVTNSLQPDIHPNNGITHSHSITRILAQKTA